MKSMVVVGLFFIIAILAATYFIVGDSFKLGDDYINDLTMLALVAIVVITVFVALKYVNQMKTDKATGDLAEENWDGIGEYKNNIPVGYGVVFIGVIVWALWYMYIGYPTNQFSQIGQWNEETLEYQAKFESKWSNISEDDLTNMGQSVYLVQCAPCHGVDGEGINGRAQNLTKRISKEGVLYAINNGANNFHETYPAGMPAGMASGADAEELATYVANGFKDPQPASWPVCGSCHGADGSGIPMVGPNLKEYSDDLVKAVLKYGKKGYYGMMPSFSGRLSETQEKAVAAYIRSIGE